MWVIEVVKYHPRDLFTEQPPLCMWGKDPVLSFLTLRGPRGATRRVYLKNEGTVTHFRMRMCFSPFVSRKRKKKKATRPSCFHLRSGRSLVAESLLFQGRAGIFSFLLLFFSHPASVCGVNTFTEQGGEFERQKGKRKDRNECGEEGTFKSTVLEITQYRRRLGCFFFSPPWQ